MDFIVVTEANVLEHICQKMQTAPVIMLDTEFVRTRTLYSRLGLIQMYDGETLALIDPIALNDLSPLWALMANQSVLKVLHACSEDLEVFQHAAGFMPSPFVDTQVMAAFLGHGLSTGFAALVHQYLDVSLDKGEARTDWCARPLTDKQLNYAAADVFYLLPLYQKLEAEIAKQGWQDALVQECQHIAQKRAKTPDPSQVYLDIKNAWQLNPKQLAALKLLASWRLQEAQRRDLALNFVVKDLHLWKMARFNLRSIEKMASADFDRFEIERHGSKLLRIMAEVDLLSPSEYPEPIERLADKAGYKQAMKLIKDQVEIVAKQLNVVPEFIGSRKQIHQCVKWVWMQQQAADKKPEMLSGWRAAYLAPRLETIMQDLAECEHAE